MNFYAVALFILAIDIINMRRTEEEPCILLKIEKDIFSAIIKWVGSNRES